LPAVVGGLVVAGAVVGGLVVGGAVGVQSEYSGSSGEVFCSTNSQPLLG
jgi:hypothetical protein